MRVDHVGVWVRDLECMRQFYVDLLGGTSGALYHNSSNGFRSYFISFAAGGTVELMQMPGVRDDPPGDSMGYAHLAFSLGSRDAVDAAALRLATAGVRLDSEPRETGDGYYEATILDPEGNRIELVA